jgi:hypothetical protein
MRKRKPPRLVVVATLTTITIVFWVFYGIYNVITSTPSSTGPSEILEPISPQLDTDSLKKLDGRVFFEEQEVKEIINLTPTPTPSTLTPTPTTTEELGEELLIELEESASPSATLTPTP